MITTILSLLGGGLGGVLRLVPEILKLFTEKGDRDHEYRMTQLQLEIDKARAQQQIDLTHAQGQEAMGVAEMNAYLEAIKGQGQMTGVPWIDAVNQSVRPFLTYWWMTLFTVYKISTLVMLANSSATMAQFVDAMWTVQDAGILAMILGFWFVDRSIRKNTGR